MLFYYVVIKILTDPIVIDMRRNFVLAAAVVSCNIASGIILCTVFRFIDRFFYDKPTVAPRLFSADTDRFQASSGCFLHR